MKIHYALVDVFTTVPFGGNPLAVFYEDNSLPTELMQKIAKELNLSETVFVEKATTATNQKRFRIFTPEMELPMAGHPTIGGTYVLAEKAIIDTNSGENNWTIEENVGDIPVTIYKENHSITKVEMKQPIPVFGDVYSSPELVAKLLSLSVDDLDQTLPVQTVSAGVPFLYVPITSLAAMKKIVFQNEIWNQHFKNNPNTCHIFTYSTETENKDATVHSRMFAPAMGISEDPATGGASGPLGAYLVHYNQVKEQFEGSYTIRSEQGIEIDRPSFIDISIQTNGTEIIESKISGTCVSIGTGELYLHDVH